MRRSARREALHRIARILASIPGVGGGTVTATLKGYVGYARDLEHVRDLTVVALDALKFADSPEEAWEEPIAQAERYVARRRLEGWELEGAGKEDPT